MAGDVRVFSSVPSTELFVELGPPMPGGSPIVIDDTNGNLYAYLSGEPTSVGGGSLPTLAAVATSGDYADLTGTPSIATVAYGVVTAGDMNMTGVLNINEIVGYGGQYLQVGNVVTFCGGYNVRATNASPTKSRLRMTLPVSTTFTTPGEAAGAAAPVDTNENAAGISGNTAQSRAYIDWIARVSSSTSVMFTMTYQVL